VSINALINAIVASIASLLSRLRLKHCSTPCFDCETYDTNEREQQQNQLKYEQEHRQHKINNFDISPPDNFIYEDFNKEV